MIRVYDDEFEEMLAADEADTLAFERSWYQRRPRGLRTPPAMPTPEEYAATAAAWSAGRTKTVARSVKRQVAHTASKIDMLLHNRDKEARRLSQLEETIRRSKANIAEATRRREEHEKQSVAAVKELDAFM